jgi:glucan phosphorylase
MRIFIDEEGMGWDQAWDITVRTMAYTVCAVLVATLAETCEQAVPSGILQHLLSTRLRTNAYGAPL